MRLARVVTLDGIDATVAEHARRLGLTRQGIWYRVSRMESRDASAAVQIAKEIGLICSRCAKLAAPGRMMCRAHLASWRDYQAERRARGLCARCSSRAVPGMTLCPAHREQNQADNARRYAARKARS